MKRSWLLCRRSLRCRCGNTTKQQLIPATPSTGSPVETGDEASSLAKQLLHRHRQQHREHGRRFLCLYNSLPAVNSVSGYGKAVLITRLARSTSVQDVGTEALLKATDDRWDKRTALERAPAALRIPRPRDGTGWPSARRGRLRAREARPAEKAGDTAFGFDNVQRRYDAVVPSGCVPDAVVARVASQSWRVNMPVSFGRNGTIRGVAARSELLERQREWQRVRDLMFSKRGDLIRLHVPRQTGNSTGVSGTSSSSGNRFYTSSAFHRYCCNIGSGKIPSEAFMIDPALYYVLGNLDATGDESLEDICRRAEELYHRYGRECDAQTSSVKEGECLCLV